MYVCMCIYIYRERESCTHMIGSIIINNIVISSGIDSLSNSRGRG